MTARFKVERDDEAFIRLVEDQGDSLDHRRDVDPRAVLGVVVT